MEKSGWFPTFKMQPFDKPEYHLLKAVKRHYSLDTDREVLHIALRLLYEVSHFEGMNGQSVGEEWIVRVINDFRNTSRESREYNIDHWK